MSTTLYGKSRAGKYKIWKIDVCGDEITVSHGYEGCKQQINVKCAKGKNIGRANETSDEEQAELEAESKIKKQIDKGYRYDKDDLDGTEVGVDLKPMLAAKVELNKLPKLFMVQPKLDGMRCLAHREGNTVKLWSRGSKPLSLPHISQELLGSMDDGEVLDGELYIHGMIFQDIMSAVKNKANEFHTEVEFHVYDMPRSSNLSNDGTATQADRMDALDLFFDYHTYDMEKPVKRVVQVQTRGINIDHIEKYRSRYLKKGYEGLIVRLFDGPYEWSTRSKTLLKYKEFQDEEFRITGVKEGKGKMAGHAVLMFSGFNAAIKMPMAKRKEIWENRKKYIGRLATVEFFERSKDGVPRHPHVSKIWGKERDC